MFSEVFGPAKSTINLQESVLVWEWRDERRAVEKPLRWSLIWHLQSLDSIIWRYAGWPKIVSYYQIINK